MPHGKIPQTIRTPSGSLMLPLYIPDATFGMVRGVDAQDLISCGVEALVMNTFHLMLKPGSSTIQALGGLHRMSGWNRPIITDSGGFQAYSLIHQNPKAGRINDKGLSFLPEGSGRKYQLTPEKSIQLQVAFGTDIAICLDDCTHVDAPYSDQLSSVDRTIAWAARCKKEFNHLLKIKGIEYDLVPKLYAVIQGGGDLELRKRCANELLEIGFDGFGYGGWPLDGSGNLLLDVLTYTRELIPANFPMHALGVGHPYNILECYMSGYGLFDSAMPTRDARHGRLYAFSRPGEKLEGKWLRYIYIEDEKNIRNDGPIFLGCDCPVCAHTSLGYLRHLFKMNDSLYPRLATLHNLRFMVLLTNQLMELDV